MIEVFRGFHLPKMNMAEVGHSKMHTHHDLSLIDAAHLDTSTMMTQEAEYIAVL